MRDMRSALGALGPVDGTNPELNNLTVAMTIVEQGDIVFLASDGISDNFDPVVGKFALPKKTDSGKKHNNNDEYIKNSEQHQQQNNNKVMTFFFKSTSPFIVLVALLYLFSNTNINFLTLNLY